MHLSINHSVLRCHSLLVVNIKKTHFNFIYQNRRKWHEKVMDFFKEDKRLLA